MSIVASKLSRIAASPAQMITALAMDLQRQGRDILTMSAGEPDFDTPEHIKRSATDALARGDTKYAAVAGLPALREAVSEFHRRKDHINASADGVLIGPGSKELMFLLMLAYYGEILLPTPCWVSYGPQAKIIGRNVQLIHTTYEERWRISAARLRYSVACERRIKPSCKSFRWLARNVSPVEVMSATASAVSNFTVPSVAP